MYFQALDYKGKNFLDLNNDNDLSSMVHTGNESLQDGLRDVQTCRTTLASAYMLYCLSVTWLQFPMEEKSSKWK